MSESYTLSEASESILLPFNFDGPSAPGHKRIRRAAISSSSDESTWEQPVDIPLKLYSTETLRFIGFKRTAAEEIMKRFHHALSEHSNMGVDFFAFIKAFLEEGPHDASSTDSDWDPVLKQMGIKGEIRAGILNRDYEHLRLSKSAKEWALETVEDGWIFVTGVDKAVKRNGKKIAQGFQGDGPGIRAKRRSEMGSEEEQASGLSAPRIITASEPVMSDDMIVLYKGGSVGRLQKGLGDGNDLLLTALSSQAPTDFSSTNNLVYFTKQRQCAFEYAAYAHARQPHLDSGILLLPVPRELMADARQVFGGEWRDLVFACRGSENYSQTALKRQALYDEDAVLVGEICAMSNVQCERLDDASQLRVMFLKNGMKGSQHVVNSARRLADIAEACKGKAMIELTVQGGS